MGDPYTYIEKDTLQNWAVQMTELNNEALDIISKIEAEVNNLNNYWQGNSANGFNKVNSDLITEAKKYHENMKSIEKMLNEIVIVAENQ